MILALRILLTPILFIPLFLTFAWGDLRILARRLAVAVGFGIYTVMLVLMAAVIFIGVFGGVR